VKRGSETTTDGSRQGGTRDENYMCDGEPKPKAQDSGMRGPSGVYTGRKQKRRKERPGTVRRRGKEWLSERYSYARTNESGAARHDAECTISNSALASGAGLRRIPGAGSYENYLTSSWEWRYAATVRCGETSERTDSASTVESEPSEGVGENRNNWK
jgi:hypothetical protein